MMMDNIKKVDLYFETASPLSISESRELMFNMVSIPLTLFNESEEVNPHLNQFPFDLSSIGVRLAYFNEVTGEELNNYVQYLFYTDDGKKLVYCKPGEGTLETLYKETVVDALEKIDPITKSKFLKSIKFDGTRLVHYTGDHERRSN